MTTAAPSHTSPTIPHNDPPERPPLITRAAAARRLGCHPCTIDRYVQRGLLRAHRDHRNRVGIELPDVERLQRAQVVTDGD